MKSRPIVFAFVSFVTLAAACGGKSQGPAGPSGPSEGDDAATPFNDGSVKAALGATPGVTDCGVAASTTMGAHIAAQKALLKGDGGVVQESFMCRAKGGGKWVCSWSVTAVSGTPAPDDPCGGGDANLCGSDANPCSGEVPNPCGGDGGTGFEVTFGVTDSGSIVPGSISCNAPG
jgi:hypothetical protein